MKTINTYINEKLVLNKSNVKDYANVIKYICIWPTDYLFDYMRSSNNYTKEFRHFNFYYILTIDQFITLLVDNNINDTRPEWSNSKFWKIPSKYNDNLDDFIDAFTDFGQADAWYNGSDLLNDYELSLDDIKEIKKTGNL